MSELTISQTIMVRQSKMQEIREHYETGTWRDVTKFGNPRREDITESSKTEDKGRRHGRHVYDGTPLGALNTWADGMQGFLVSGNWFKSAMSNPLLNKIDGVRDWLQHYDRVMYSAFERGNFYAVLAEWFRDAGSIGTATLYTEEDVADGNAVHVVIHPREVYIAEDKSGDVDTVHRKFSMTARAAVQKFNKPGDTLSQQIRDNAENSPDKTHEFIHAVFPNTDRIVGKKTAKNKKFRSVYLETSGSGSPQAQNTGEEVRDSGFDINPYAVWRFRKSSDEIYGYSPMSDAIVEVFGLNQMGKTLLMAGHKSVSPPMNVPIEMRGRVRNTPDGNNYYDSEKRLMSAVQTGINYPIGIDQQERLQKILEDKFRVEFFRAFIGRQGEATATEIMAIKGEQAGLMIAQTDRVYVEGIRKVFDIVSAFEERRGAFSIEAGMPPIPDEIAESGGTINFILTGPLAQAQRRITVLQPINDTGLALDAWAERLGPQVYDVINSDELAEIITEAGSFPQIAINGKDKRLAIQQARQATIEEEKQRQAMLDVAGVAPGLGKAPEPGSAGEAIGEAISA